MKRKRQQKNTHLELPDTDLKININRLTMFRVIRDKTENISKDWKQQKEQNGMYLQIAFKL